jgi:serine/threonine-protein phosphatase 2A regulatory subunit A
MLLDPVFTIRESALVSMIEISKLTDNQDWLVRTIGQKIQEFSKHERFMIRIQAIHFINRLAPEVTKEVLNKQFMETILLLAEDPVPNIRFNVSKCIESFYTKMTPGSKFKCESAVKKMAKDTDFDSSYFAKRALEAIEKL